MKSRWKDNRIKEKQEGRGKGVLHGERLNKHSSPFLTKETLYPKIDLTPVKVHSPDKSLAD